MKSNAKEFSTWQEVAGHLDYACLLLDVQERDLRLACLEAEKFHIPTIVVNPVNVQLVSCLLKGTEVKTTAAVSYPVGAYPPEAKMREIEDALEDGANEIYMVMAVGAYLSGWNETYTLPEMRGLVKTAGGRRTTLVTEASVLSDAQKVEVTKMAIDCGINALVTGEGFHNSKLSDPTNEDLEVFVKAADGKLDIVYMNEIENEGRAAELFKLGIHRICTPSVRQILSGYANFPGIA